MGTGIAKLVAVVIAGLVSATAHADLVPDGQLGVLSNPGNISFANTNVTPGTVATVGDITYNFLDRWHFTLDSLANVAGLVASINFTAGPGGPILFGISNLQINLRTDPPSGPPLVSWLTVTTPAAGLQQSIALLPSSPLSAGNYIFDVRGTVSVPGAYSGSLVALAAVPLPAALPLFGVGLAVFGSFAHFKARRRRP